MYHENYQRGHSPQRASKHKCQLRSSLKPSLPSYLHTLHPHLESTGSKYLPTVDSIPINRIPSGTSSTIEGPPFQLALNTITCAFPVHHPRISEYMSTDDIGATLPLPSFNACIFPPSYFPYVVHGSGRKSEGLVVHQHPGTVCSLIFDQASPGRIYAPRTAETTPNPNHEASHGCPSQSEFSHAYRFTPYNAYPTQSVVRDPLIESQQCGSGPDSPRTDASWDDGSLYGFRDGHPELYLVKDAPSSANSSLSLGAASPPFSKSSGATPIPEGLQFSGPSVIDSPVPNIFPSLRSREDQQDQEAWTHTLVSVATPVGMDGCRDNYMEAMTPYGPQESSPQALYRPRRILPPSPVPQPYFGTSPSSRSPPAYPSDFLAVHSSSQATPQHQSRAANTKKRPEKKYWCSSCRSGFSQSQVLGRHIKDKHETKRTCHHCKSFTWSGGRPHLYREHLQMQHPQLVLPEVGQKSSRHTKKRSKPHVQGARYAKKSKLHAYGDKGCSAAQFVVFPCAKQ
ncbi:hypothetical protein H4582DRAFT_948970 [Lactarius indigo]|nr:hypothetical protein H4582DRAFT_948970 [Lactarius indigo]